MRGLLVRGAGRKAGLLLVVLVAVAAQVAHAPRAEAVPGDPTMRDTRATAAADEVLTVDVLGIDDPPAGATWVRSSVCVVEDASSCPKKSTRDGRTTVANDDGTLTTYASSGSSGSSVVTYLVEGSNGGRYTARLLVTVRPSDAPRTGEPDPGVRSRLRVTQRVARGFDHAGQVVRWTSVVTNTGNVALAGLAVTDASPVLPARTCAPVPVGGTLAAGASTTCTADLTVQQRWIDENVARTDAVTATGTAVRSGTTYRASASAFAGTYPVQRPGLSMTASADATTVSTPTQSVTYTFVPRNSGKVTLRHLLVRAPFPGLSALVCAPVPLGGELAPGESTTCRATRTVPAELFPSATLTDTARAGAQTYWRTYNATSEVSVGLQGSPVAPRDPVVAPVPSARPDSVSTTVGHPVVVAVLDNDTAGAPQAPLVGRSVRLRLAPGLPFPQLYGDARTLIVPPVFNRPVDPLVGGAAFLVSGRGEITVVPLGPLPPDVLTVGYQVADADGRTSRSTLTVTVTR